MKNVKMDVLKGMTVEEREFLYILEAEEECILWYGKKDYYIINDSVNQKRDYYEKNK